MKILITGALSGLGYRLGEKLALRGHTVYFTVHTKSQLITLRNKLKQENIKAKSFKMDITTDDIKLVDFLDIDCLINHAGIGVGGSILYMDINDLKYNYEVNVFSSFRLLQRVYLNMEKRHIKGKIFVTSSLASKIVIPFLGCYTSSKASISMLVRTINKELKYLNNGITISLIEPGAYKTGFNQVMIDNKDKYLYKDCLFYKNRSSINTYQRNIFNLIESNKYDSLVDKVIYEIESNKPKFIIRRPIIQGLFTKIYNMFNS